MYEEWYFRKPNWLFIKIFCCHRKLYSREYITFSKTFDNTHSRNTGLKLLNNKGSPDLKSGSTFASFSSPRNTPSVRDLLHNWTIHALAYCVENLRCNTITPHLSTHHKITLITYHNVITTPLIIQNCWMHWCTAGCVLGYHLVCQQTAGFLKYPMDLNGGLRTEPYARTLCH